LLSKKRALAENDAGLGLKRQMLVPAAHPDPGRPRLHSRLILII